MKQRLIELANQLKFKQGDTAWVSGMVEQLTRCETCGQLITSRYRPTAKRVQVIGVYLRVLEKNFTEVWYDVRHRDRCTQQVKDNNLFRSREDCMAEMKRRNE